MASSREAAETDHAGSAFVKIKVNGVEMEIHRGRQSVTAIKEKGGVLQADVLAQVVNGQLVDLPDDGHVVIKGGEEFHSHPRDSGSSHSQG